MLEAAQAQAQAYARKAHDIAYNEMMKGWAANPLGSCETGLNRLRETELNRALNELPWAGTAPCGGSLKSVMSDPHIGCQAPSGPLTLESSKMQQTGDRHCVARGTTIIFEGTLEEAQAFAESHAKFNEGSRLSVYAPVSVVTSTSKWDVSVQIRQVGKARK